MAKILEMEILYSQIESPQENLHIEDKMLMGPDNLCVNSQEEKGLESSQEEGQLEDYEDEVAEEEESEEEEEEIIHDGQDVTDREEVSEYVDTEDEEESQDEEDLENMKEKKGLSIQQNLFLHPSNYGRNEAKCKINKEKQVTNIPTEFPVSVMMDICGNFDANLYATSLKEESTESEEAEKEDGILIDSGTREETAPKNLDLPNEVQAHSTSMNSAVRKALGFEEEEDAESPWFSESPTESLPKGSARHIPAATDQTVKDSISMRQHEDVFYIPSFMNGSRNFKMDKLMDTRSTDIAVGNVDYLERHPNLKPIQPSIEMKDSFTNQEVEKAVKGNKKSNLMEEFGLGDADDIDDASDWDSISTSQKNESYRNSKDLNFNIHYPCQSLPVTKNQSGSTEFGKIPLKEEEASGARSGPETGFRVVILGEKPVPQEQCEPQLSLKKEEGKEDINSYD